MAIKSCANDEAATKDKITEINVIYKYLNFMILVSLSLSFVPILAGVDTNSVAKVRKKIGTEQNIKVF